MALNTGGFPLAVYAARPDIPDNVGRLDVGAIYDMAKKGMETNEMMRTALARQQAVDEELKAQRALALAQQQTYPAQGAATVATANRTAALASPEIVGREVANTGVKLDADLAAEQSRRDTLKFVAALPPARQLALAKFGPETSTSGSSVLGPDGNVRTTSSEVARIGGEVIPVSSSESSSPYALMKGVPGEIRTFEQLTAGMSPADKEAARRIHLGMVGRASSAGAQSIEVKQPDGSIQRYTFDPRTGGYSLPAVGAVTPVPALATPVAAPAPTPVAPAAAPAAPEAPTTAPAPAPAAEAPNFRGQSTADAQRDKTKAAETEKLKVEKQAALPKAQQSIRDWDANAKNVLTTLADVDQVLGTFSDGPGLGAKRRVAASVPGTDEYNLKKAIETVQANVAFDKLSAMRAASKTGGALGNVSDADLRLLQSSIASLDLGQDISVIRQNIQKVVQRYQQMNASQHQAFDQEFKDILPSTAPAAHPLDNEAVTWAKAHPQDPRSAAILKANGL